MLRNLFLVIFTAICLVSSSQAVMLDTAQGRYMSIGDVRIHYKVWGKGEPILLLHGAMEYWREWEKQIPAFAKTNKVIAVDTRGHGESTFTDRELSYELFADDMIVLMRNLNIDSINVVGFGDGGIIGMQMAIKKPDLVHKLVAIGPNLTPDTNAVYNAVLEKVRAWDFDKMAFYLQVKFKENPNPKLLSLVAKRMQKLLLTQPHMGLADLERIQCPTLIMGGDHDFIKIKHLNFIYENLPNGYLSIIPAGTHYCNKDKSVVVNATVLDFIHLKPEKVSRY